MMGLGVAHFLSGGWLNNLAVGTRAFIASTRRHVPQAEERIAFDKFHVAQMLGNAVDRVRRAERKKLRHDGDDVLKGTRYYWLQNPDHMDEQRWN